MTFDDGKLKPAEILREAGIVNATRLVALIKKTINFLKLDLSGLTVLTEAASGPYVVTPIIAGMAHAKRVLALTNDSSYATVEEIILQTRALETLCSIEGKTEIRTVRSLNLFAEADVVTNLGFVRPIDKSAVAEMKPSAVVSLMCESWEVRHKDVDLGACLEKGIAVLGTNENYPGLEVFDYSGWLCLKMLFDAQIEIHKSKILVVGGDKFSSVIANQLQRCRVFVQKTPDLRSTELLVDIDAVIIADYTREDMIIGPEGDLAAADLASMAPAATVIQFAGRVDVPSLNKCGISVYPGFELGSRRMAKTLAELGVRPVVELHTGGLKVGEVLSRSRLFHGLSVADSIERAIAQSPAQLLID